MDFSIRRPAASPAAAAHLLPTGAGVPILLVTGVVGIPRLLRLPRLLLLLLLQLLHVLLLLRSVLLLVLGSTSIVRHVTGCRLTQYRRSKCVWPAVNVRSHRWRLLLLLLRRLLLLLRRRLLLLLLQGNHLPIHHVVAAQVEIESNT